MFERVVDGVLAVMDAIGAPGVGVAILLETVFPPVPSEVVLPLAGFTAFQGRYGLVEAIAWATAGSLVGALLLYGLGAAFGQARLARIADRLPLTRAEDVHRAVAWFDRYGSAAILVGRVVPGVRSLISIPAGVDRMPLPRFVLYTFLGSTVWNSLLVGSGYLLGTRWHLVEQRMDVVSKVVYLALALVLVAFVGWLLRRRLRERDPA